MVIIFTKLMLIYIYIYIHVHGLCQSELTMGSILNVCLVGEPTSVSVEANVGGTVLCRGCICAVSSLLRLSLFSVSLWQLVSASPPLIWGVWSVVLSTWAGCLPGSPRPLLMSTVFMSGFMTSQFRSCSHPVGLFPQASSPYRRSLGMWPPGMWWMWPSQRRLRCLSSVNMMGRLCKTGPQCWAPCLCCLCYKNCYFIKGCSFC